MVDAITEKIVLNGNVMLDNRFKFNIVFFILRLLLFENELNSFSRLNNLNSLTPKDATKLSALFDVYQRKYLDNKRDTNRNFQTQGWK